MSIREQARTELAAVNFGEEDSRVMLEILDKFFEQWDSGGAVAVASDVLARLVAGQPLGPLTGNDSEWVDVSQWSAGETVFQNARCSSVFKDGTGKAYDINAGNNRAPITFPYDPTTRLPQMPVYEIDASGKSTEA
jgi:hypothetical protein